MQLNRQASGNGMRCAALADGPCAPQGVTMSSYAWSVDDLAACDISYWLPPGGRDNGVWADRWALIADLDADDVAEVLDRLADADVGGYAAIPGGRRARAKGPVPYSLWVDVTQYHRAENVLMVLMRGRHPDFLPTSG